MKLANIFVPGLFDDAFVYMGRLLAFTTEKTVRVWNLERIAEQILNVAPRTRPAPELLFSRNDWLATGVFESMMGSPRTLKSFLAQLDNFPTPHFELEAHSCDQEFDLDVASDHLLDVLIYRSRLYLGTEKGLFHRDLRWDSDGEVNADDAQRRLDSRCISTSAAYSAVLASCGDEGLFAATDDFGWTSGNNGRLKRTASKSIRSAWMGDDIVNYRSSSDLTVFRAQYSDQENLREHHGFRDEKRERRVLIDIGTDIVSVEDLFTSLERKYDIHKDDIQFVFNSKRVFFLNTYTGRLFGSAFQVPAGIGQPGQKSGLAFLKEYASSGSSIISASATRVGIVFETDSEVSVFANNTWTPIVKESAVSVRTFIRSKRFQNLVAVTLENGLLLTALFDDKKYARG
jgi:hypothetical protein